LTSVAVMPSTPTPVSAWRTASSLKGFMIAMMIFISCPSLVLVIARRQARGLAAHKTVFKKRAKVLQRSNPLKLHEYPFIALNSDARGAMGKRLTSMQNLILMKL
jgi:hypothetical protein